MTIKRPTVTPATKQKLDAILKKHVDLGLIPAATFAVATADSKAEPLYFKAEGDKVFGQPDKGQINEDTILQLMSMTKLMVSLAVLQLVDAGKLTLDEPAIFEKYLPELGKLPIVGAVQDGKSVEHPATKKITVRQILTHTNGTGYDVMVPALGEWVKVNNKATVISTNLTVESFELPLIFEPGEGWNYSLGLDWGGILVERVTGKSLEQYFQENIFKPSGVTTLTFTPPDEAYIKLQQVVTHDPIDNKLVVFPGIRDCSPGSAKGQASGGAGLYGTAHDYLRVLQKGQYDFARLVPHIDVKLIDNAQLTHSLGGFVCTADSSHGRKTGSMWWEGIYKTFYWMDPLTGVTGVFTTQLFAFGVPNEPFDLVFNELERAFYDGLH
ncbi:hypothetical protein JCM24511_10081 [Saitozyma sp. JCM 24511]|nr:hypothetical protein JCM24511_10081 [Saitozyma sp. JCM 24511]